MGLSPDRPANKHLRTALKDILEGKSPPDEFIFNHNGVTLSAENIEFIDGRAILTEPRVLNGAQTVTSSGEVPQG